jgi:hypothetical protein
MHGEVLRMLQLPRLLLGVFANCCSRSQAACCVVCHDIKLCLFLP